MSTSRGSKAEMGASTIYTLQAKTEREARGRRAKAPTTVKVAKDLGKVYRGGCTRLFRGHRVYTKKEESDN